MLRKAAECNVSFPYLMRTVCYVEILRDDGEVNNPEGLNEVRDAVRRLGAGESRLYAVWPGQWASDLFEIDYEGAARALNILD